MSRPLGSAFYAQPTLDLARDLLGRHLVRIWQGERLCGRIVEVEAYHQDGDRAAHSYSGASARNRVMFGPPGHLYVYFIYGMHHCMNVVSEAESLGAAILIRALEPIEGLATMGQLRGPKAGGKNLTNGPARCCQALAVDRSLDGISLQGPEMFLEAGQPCTDAKIIKTTRIGISKSIELPWRFLIEGNPCVSRKPTETK